MSTVKSSAESLTLNADGSGNDVLIQSNGSTKAIVTAEGNLGVGTNTPVMASTSYNGLHVNATYPTVKLSANATGHAATDGFHLRIDSTPRVEYWNYENSDQVFANNNGVKLRLLAGGGLCFGTDTAAANALSDYEEGTFTPSISGLSVTGTGQYTKVGNMVTAQGYIDVTGGTFAADAVLIGNMPFTTNSASNNRSVGSLMYQQVDVADDYLELVTYIPESSTNLRVYEIGDNKNWRQLPKARCSTDTFFAFQVTYRSA